MCLYKPMLGKWTLCRLTSACILHLLILNGNLLLHRPVCESAYLYFLYLFFFSLLPPSDSVLVCESLLFQCRRGGGGWCWWGLG